MSRSITSHRSTVGWKKGANTEGTELPCAGAVAIAAAVPPARLAGRELPAIYDGYGACPLTVERGDRLPAQIMSR